MDRHDRSYGSFGYGPNWSNGPPGIHRMDGPNRLCIHWTYRRNRFYRAHRFYRAPGNDGSNRDDGLDRLHWTNGEHRSARAARC